MKKYNVEIEWNGNAETADPRVFTDELYRFYLLYSQISGQEIIVDNAIIRVIVKVIDVLMKNKAASIRRHKLENWVVNVKNVDHIPTNFFTTRIIR